MGLEDHLPPLAVKPTVVVGGLVLRSYVLANEAGHYDGVIGALEARGLKVLPAFATGLDARPAIEKFFIVDGAPVVDAVISLTGFSLVGGPAYNDAVAAEASLSPPHAPHTPATPPDLPHPVPRGQEQRRQSGSPKRRCRQHGQGHGRQAGCSQGGTQARQNQSQGPASQW